MSEVPSETVVPRSRVRFWVAGIVVVLLLLGAAFAYEIYRPLTPMEKRIIGTWSNITNPGSFTFHANRSVTAAGFPPGTWYIRDETLHSSDSGFTGTISSLLGKASDSPMKLTFEDDNTLSVVNPLNGSTSKWKRVPKP